MPTREGREIAEVESKLKKNVLFKASVDVRWVIHVFRCDIDQVLAAACLPTSNVGGRNGHSRAAVVSSVLKKRQRARACSPKMLYKETAVALKPVLEDQKRP